MLDWLIVAKYKRVISLETHRLVKHHQQHQTIYRSEVRDLMFSTIAFHTTLKSASGNRDLHPKNTPNINYEDADAVVYCN